MKLYRPALRVVGECRNVLGLGLGYPILSFGDECGNGHNTFSITVDGYNYGGCCHDFIKSTWPEYAHLIPFHLVSTDGPMHYIANSLYHKRHGNLEGFRNCAVWPSATVEDMESADQDVLVSRFPFIMDLFTIYMKEVFDVSIEVAKV